MAFGFDAFRPDAFASTPQEETAASAPVEPEPVSQEETAASAPAESVKAKAKAKPKAKRHSKPSGPSKAGVEKVLQVHDALCDDAFRSRLSELSGKSDDAALAVVLLDGLGVKGLTGPQVSDVLSAVGLADDESAGRVLDALAGSESRLARVQAVLSGRVSAPARLLVGLHDAADDLTRVKLVHAADEKTVRDAVRLANLIGGLDLKTAGNAFDVAANLAFAAGALDVDSVRRLV